MTNYEKLQEAEKIDPYVIAEVEEIATCKKFSAFIDAIFGGVSVWDTESGALSRHTSIDEFNQEFAILEV